MLHSKATGSLWGCGTCMNDVHTCKYTHTHTQPVISDTVPGFCVQPPQGTNNQITSSDGWSHLTSASPFSHVLSNNTLAIFVMSDIIYAWLSEFAQNYDHLAHADDLHLHSFSCGDDYVIRWSKLASLIVFNSCLSQMARYSFEGTQINVGETGVLLIYPKPLWCPGRETIDVRDTKWILLSCVFSQAINIIWLVTW